MTSKLTVLVPVYNGMPYLPEAVESILNQTLRDFTLLIIDDGSTDGTASYLDGLHDPRLRIVLQENQGQGAALNRGLAICDTKYVALMDADDISLPGRLKEQFEYMERDPEVVMLGTQVTLFAGKREFRGAALPLTHEEIRRLLLRDKAAFCHAAGMFRTDVMKKIGGYRTMKSGQEMDIFLRMSDQGKIANLDEMLYLIRIHRSSDNFLRRDQIKKAAAYAIKCARCRQKGVLEPTPETFEETWGNRGVIRKALDRLDSWSAVKYRNALVDLSESRSVRGYAGLVIAALLRPEGVARRVSGYFFRR